MKIRHSFILVFTVSLFIPIAIPLVNSAWSEAVLGVAGSGVPIILDGGDFSGDGADDLSIFTPRGGVWRIRGLTAAYFGREGDYPAAGDYDGDGISDIAVFRPESGLWAVRGTTRFYFGLSGDLPAARDYAGDGVREPAVFRPRTGIWAIRGVEPIPFGREGDLPVPADYTGDGSAGIGVFRPATGLWAIRGLTRVYFGRPGDLPVPGDYLGEGTAGLAIYRASSGLWAIRRFTRVYFGGPGFIPAPLYYTGSEAIRIAVYDPARGLWAIRGVTRLYSGRTGGVPIPGYYLSEEPAEEFAPPEIRGGGTPPPTSTPEPTATSAPTATPALTSTATPTPIPTPTIPLLDEGFDFFHQGRRPEGWIFNNCDSDTDTYLTSGNYGRKPPSLKLDATDDAVITSEFSRPEELTFWLKGQGTDISSALLVDEYDGADWHRLTDIYSLPTSGTDFPALALNPSTSQVKFTYLKSTGNLAFDDVRISEPATPSPVPTATAIPTPSFSPTPTVAPTATPSPSTTATSVPSSTPSPTISPVPSASTSPSPIPWDGGMLENAGFESWTESDAYYWSWDGPSDQWLRSEDCYYEVYAGRFRREAATEGNLDQFGKSMIQGVTYFAVLMAKGTGEIRLGIRYPHTAYSSYGDWTVFSSAEWTLLEHQASPPGSGSEGGLRIQVRSCYEPYLVIDNAYLADIPLFPTPTTTPTPPPTATPTVTPTPFGVVINEIIYNPVGADAGQEWIELYNTSGIEKILTGHCLRLNVSSTPYQFPEYTLGAYSYVIVHTNAVGTDTATELYSPAPIANMGNTSGSVSFCNGNPPAAGNLIDFVQYGAGGQTWESSAVTAGIWSEGDFVPTVSEGHSMGRNPNGWDTDLSEDWMEFYVPTGGGENLIIPTPSPTAQPTATPSPAPQDNEGPQISWQMDSYPDYLEITGTATDLLSNINSVYFQIAAFHEGTDGECSYWLPVSTNPCLPDDGSFNSLTEDFFAILDTTYFHCEYGRYFEAVSQISASDSAGNWTAVTTFGPEAGWNTLCPNACNGFWEPEDLPRVIINEFMANPEGPEPANEWIELLNPNPSSSQVLLSGWTLGDAATPGEVSAYAGIFTFPASPPVYLAGGEYLVLGGSPEAAGGNVDMVYNLPGNTLGAIQLGNTQDRIILRDAQGRLVDEVRYDSTWKIREGESLARKTVVRLADFVELYNKSGDEINLAGLYLSKGKTPSIVVPYSTATAVISPYSYGLVFGSLFPQELYPDLPAEVLVVTVDNADISGGIGVDDHLTLIEGATEVDSFHPDNVIGGARPQLGQSVERVDPEVGDILGNWDLNEDYGSTPGEENSVTP